MRATSTSGARWLYRPTEPAQSERRTATAGVALEITVNEETLGASDANQSAPRAFITTHTTSKP